MVYNLPLLICRRPDMKETIKNFKGIFTSPGPTLGKLMEKKQWLAALVLILALVFIFTYLATPELMNKARDSEYLYPEQLEYLGNISGFKLVMAGFWGMFITLLTFFAAAFLTYLFFGIARAEGTYANYFSLVVNTSLIGKALPLILSILSVLFRLPLTEFSNLAALIPVSPGSLAFMILSKFDIFYIWYLVAMAAGVSVYSKMNLRKCLVVALLYFGFVSTVKIAFSVLFFKLLAL
jgi:hypothetical protein